MILAAVIFEADLILEALIFEAVILEALILEALNEANRSARQRRTAGR